MMGTIASQITSLTIVYSTIYSFIQTQIKENIKAPRHWPLCGEFTGEFPTQMVSNAENVSIWWRHHAMSGLCKETAKESRMGYMRSNHPGGHSWECKQASPRLSKYKSWEKRRFFLNSGVVNMYLQDKTSEDQIPWELGTLSQCPCTALTTGR